MIDFFNIKTGERVSLDNPAHIAAYVNSSDLGINSSRGQDFKWRLAPELKAKVDEMRVDPRSLKEVSQASGVPLENISVTDIVEYLSEVEARERRIAQVQIERDPEFASEYEKQVAAAKNKSQPAAANVPPETKKKR